MNNVMEFAKKKQRNPLMQHSGDALLFGDIVSVVLSFSSSWTIGHFASFRLVCKAFKTGVNDIWNGFLEKHDERLFKVS